MVTGKYGIHQTLLCLRVDAVSGKVSAPYGFVGDITGNATSASSANEALTLEGLDSSQFIRSDANDTGSGRITLTYNDPADPYTPLEIRGGGNHTGLYINPHTNKQGHIRFAADGALKWQMRVPFQDGVNAPLKIYSWVDGADRYTFNHNGYLNTVGLTALGGYVRSQYNSTQYAQLESNASGGVIKGSGGGGFFFRSYGDSYMNGGNVGIGTSDPETFIHINGGHGDARSQITYNHAADPTHVNSSNLLQWVSEPGITYQGGGIGSNINKGGQYYGRYNNSVNYGVYLRFDPVNGYSEFHATTGDGGVTGGQGIRVFRVGPTGNTSISGSLNVSSTATIDDTVSLGSDGTYGAGYGTVGFGGTTNGYNRIFGNTSTADGLFLASATGRGIFFRTNGSGVDSMSINPSGQVGIGVDSARGKLELNGNGQAWATAPGIRVWDSYNSKGWFVGSANNVATGDFYIRTLPNETDNPAAANQKEFVIKHSTGNVGIGTLSPSSKLEVDGVVSATGGNSTNWNTAYGWGNHAGLYDSVGSASDVQAALTPQIAGAQTTADNAAAAAATAQSAANAAQSTANDADANATAAKTQAAAAQATADAALPKAGGTMTGNVTAPSFTGRLQGGLSGAPDATIWCVSGQYTDWGIFYDEGSPDKIHFKSGGVSTANIALDTGVVTASGGNSGNWNTAYGWGNHASQGYATLSGSNSFSNSYNEFGNGVGSVSNDGGWNGRLNVAGTQHARLDVVSVSDGIVTTTYSHTGQGMGKMGTISNHPLGLMTAGGQKVMLGTGGNMYPVNDRTQLLGLDTNRWQVVFCEILDSAGLHEKNLQNPEGEKSVGEYETGTVLVWKGGKNVPCTEPADHMRMGIAVKGVSSPLVQGAEPVLCTGEVNEGDYLVTSSVEGHAAAISPQYMRQHNLFDCVLGKALEGGNGDSHIIKTWVNI